jgi:hypothetical protein
MTFSNDCALRPAEHASVLFGHVEAAIIKACGKCHSTLFHIAKVTNDSPTRLFCSDCLTEITV